MSRVSTIPIGPCRPGRYAREDPERRWAMMRWLALRLDAERLHPERRRLSPKLAGIRDDPRNISRAASVLPATSLNDQCTRTAWRTNGGSVHPGLFHPGRARRTIRLHAPGPRTRGSAESPPATPCRSVPVNDSASRWLPSPRCVFSIARRGASSGAFGSGRRPG
jgi:hypothetical protein